MYQLLNRLKIILIFFIIMLILSFIYTIFLFTMNTEITFDNFLINNNYISYFIGLISFFILGILSVIKSNKNILLNSIINFLIVYLFIFSLQIISDHFSFNNKQIIKFFSYLFITLCSTFLFSKKKV